MKSIFLSLLFLSINVFWTPFEKIDSTIQLISNWKKGEKFKVKTSYKVEKGIPGQMLKFESELFADIVVVDSSKDSYTIEWTYTKSNISPNDNSLDNQLKASLKDLKFVYKISNAGAFVSLLNYEQIKSKVNQAFDTLLLKLGGSPSKVQLQQTRQVVMSQQGIQTVLMKDVMAFHFALGKEYETNKIQQGQIQIPSIFGGQPYNAIETIELPIINKQTKVCIIKTNKKVKDPRFIEDTKGYLKKIATENNQTISGDIKSSDFDFSETTYHEVDYLRGVPLKSVLTRNFEESVSKSKNFSEITVQLMQ